MGRMTPNDAKYLNTVSLRDRAAILKIYLKSNYNQKEIAIKVFNNYDDWASMSVSSVTRSFGFHEGKGKGRYRNIPDHVIDQFVRDYDPVDYDEGLDEGTFDYYIKGYLKELEQQRQQEEQQRLWEKQQAEEQKKRQEEYERQQKKRQEEYERQQREWAAQQERERLRREAEKKQREEAQRLERLRIEREEKAREAARQAAIDRGDHITLMDEAFDALKAKNFELAKAKAEKAWDIKPMIGLQYVLAYCFDAEGDSRKAAEWAWDAKAGYEEGSQNYIDMLVLYLNNNGGFVRDAAAKLHKYGKLGFINENGIKRAVNGIFDSIYYVSGGTKIENDYASDETKAVMEFLATLVAYRDYPVIPNNEQMLLKCAFVLTQQGYYTMARDIYLDLEKQVDSRKMFGGYGNYYDLKVNLGKCLYELEDYDGAIAAWFPESEYTDNYVTRPLEAGMYYGYDGDMLDVSGNHPEVRRELELADAYRNGRITGSRYFSRFYGNDWRDVLNVNPGVDIRWYADQFGEWKLEEFTPGFKDMLGKLFGR